MSNEFKTRLLDLGAPVVVSVLVIAISFIIGGLEKRVFWQAVTLVIAVLLMSSCVAAFVATLIVRHNILPFLSPIRQAIYSLITSRSISDEFMAEHERVCSCKEIWIVTPDLHKDIHSEDEPFTFEDIVSNNTLNRNIAYTYIVPATSDTHTRVNALLAPYSDGPEKPRVVKLPPDKWKLLPYIDGDFIIYNPLSKPGSLIEAYYELPIKGRNQWVRVEDKTALSWVGRIIDVVPEILDSNAGKRSS